MLEISANPRTQLSALQGTSACEPWALSLGNGNRVTLSQLSALSSQLSALSSQLSALSSQLSLIPNRFLACRRRDGVARGGGPVQLTEGFAETAKEVFQLAGEGEELEALLNALVESGCA